MDYGDILGDLKCTAHDLEVMGPNLECVVLLSKSYFDQKYSTPSNNVFSDRLSIWRHVLCFQSFFFIFRGLKGTIWAPINT